jgi:Ca2+-binding EF-hand superfamily protein
MSAPTAPPVPPPVPVDRHAMLHAVFVKMDADGSGEIDREEFMSLFSDKESKHANRFLDEIDNVSGKGDGKGDGQLSSNEVRSSARPRTCA